MTFSQFIINWCILSVCIGIPTALITNYLDRDILSIKLKIYNIFYSIICFPVAIMYLVVLLTIKFFDK